MDGRSHMLRNLSVPLRCYSHSKEVLPSPLAQIGCGVSLSGDIQKPLLGGPRLSREVGPTDPSQLRCSAILWEDPGAGQGRPLPDRPGLGRSPGFVPPRARSLPGLCPAASVASRPREAERRAGAAMAVSAGPGFCGARDSGETLTASLGSAAQGEGGHQGQEADLRGEPGDAALLPPHHPGSLRECGREGPAGRGAGAGAGRQGKLCRALSAGHIRRGEPGHLLLRRLRLDVGELRAPSFAPAAAPGLGFVRGPRGRGHRS